MTYIIKADFDKHPMHGKELELFRISYNPSPTPPPPNKKWVRDDENGQRWGFEHPVSGEVVHMHPAGVGPEPKVGQITSVFTVVEVVESSALLTSASAEMGTPELFSYNPEEVLIVTDPPEDE